MILFQASDPEGRPIVLTADAWAHIQAGHPEIDLVGVEATLTAPEVVAPSKGMPSREVYERVGANPGFPDKPLWVIVDSLTSPFIVITAYMSRKPLEGGDRS